MGVARAPAFLGGGNYVLRADEGERITRVGCMVAGLRGLSSATNRRCSICCEHGAVSEKEDGLLKVRP